MRKKVLFQSWIDVTTGALQAVWEGFILFIPSLVGALVILIVGWLVAIALDKIVSKIINLLKVDVLLEKLGVGKLMSKAGTKLNAGKFLGFITKWFIILVVLMAAANVLKLDSVNFFLQAVLAYVPNIIAAVIILLITVWATDFLERLVKVSVMATTEIKSGLMSVVTRWTVLIFGLLAALNQLGIAPMFIQSLITGIIAMLAIAGGLAFGLGGKEHASELISKVKRDLMD